MTAPRILLLNPPSPAPVSRRYCGTTGARGFLYPPLELTQLAAVARTWHGCTTLVLDAIARGLDESETLECAMGFGPDITVAMMGFSTFRSDVTFLGSLTRRLAGTLVGAMGYLPSRYPDEFLARTGAGFVLMDEPEETFSELIGATVAGRESDGVAGLERRGGSGRATVRPPMEGAELDRLPFAVPHGVALAPYRELLQPAPMWSLLSSRGCPFACTFCVTTYGKTARFRSAASVVEEIELLSRRYGIRSIRFVDDTFTLRRERVLEICDRLKRLALPISWTALSRLDTLDDELLRAMRGGGCRRLDFGIESGSQRILDRMRKGLTAGQIPALVERVRATGIEALGFFIVGAPEESEEELQASIDLAIRSDLDYVVVTRLQSWPGTPQAAFDSEALPPSPAPFDAPPAIAGAAESERRFYRSFYFRPGYMLPRLPKLLAQPRASASAGAWLLGYVASGGEADHI